VISELIIVNYWGSIHFCSNAGLAKCLFLRIEPKAGREAWVHSRATLTTRTLPSLTARSAVISCAVAVAVCLIVSACSPGADYPSIFPAVQNTPPQRTEAPLDAEQVQQATEDLISDRNRLNSDAQGTQSKTSVSPVPKSKNSAAATAKKPTAIPSPAAAAAAAAGARRPIAADDTLTAGAETK
jgi:hypothetical protein